MVFTDWAQAKQWVQLDRKLCPASEQEFSVHSLHFKHIYRQSKLVTATGTPFHVCDRGLAVTPLAILLLHLRELGTLSH